MRGRPVKDADHADHRGRRTFAVFSDVHGNLPGLEAILADVERRGVPQTLSLGDLVGYGPSPNEVALLVRDRGIPSLMGNYDQGIGFETGDCGCVYKTDEQRAEGAVVALVDAGGRDRRGQGVSAHPRGPLHARHARRRPARGARQPQAHQRVPLRGPSRRGHGAYGARVPLPRHLLRAYARALRQADRRDDLRQRRQRRPPQGRRLARLLRDRRPGTARRTRLRRVRARPLRLRAPAARPRRDAADHELPDRARQTVRGRETPA